VLRIALGLLAVFLRTAWLCVTVNVRHGLVWATKIVTDPFHDAWIYSKRRTTCSKDNVSTR
jgi:hypothetical protein